MSVYFISSHWNGPFKIGMGKNPIRRMAELQTATPNQLVLHATIDAWHRTDDSASDGTPARDCDVERTLHAYYKRAKMVGEWFDIPFHRIYEDIMVSWILEHGDECYDIEPVFHSCETQLFHHLYECETEPFTFRPTPKTHWYLRDV